MNQFLRNSFARLWGPALRPASATLEVPSRLASILFLKPHQSLGDLLVCVPLFRAVKRAHPSAKVYVLCNPENHAAIRNSPWVDESLVFNKNRWWDPAAAARLLRTLRRWKPDAAVQLVPNSASLTSALLGRMSGTSRLIGFDPAAYGEIWGKEVFHQTLPAPREADRYEGEIYAELLKPLGIKVEDYSLHYAPSDESVRLAQDWLSRHTRPGTRVVGIQPGGSDDPPGRLWPAEWFGGLALAFRERDDVSVVLIGMPGAEEKYVERAQAGLPADVPVFMERGLDRYAGLLKGLDLYVSNDGGGLHLAAACGTKTFGIFRAASGVRWNPRPLNTHLFLQSAYPKTDPAEPSAVFGRLQALL